MYYCAMHMFYRKLISSMNFGNGFELSLRRNFKIYFSNVIYSKKWGWSSSTIPDFLWVYHTPENPPYYKEYMQWFFSFLYIQNTRERFDKQFLFTLDLWVILSLIRDASIRWDLVKSHLSQGHLPTQTLTFKLMLNNLRKISLVGRIVN